MTLLQAIRRVRFEMLRTWWELRKDTSMYVPIEAYFRKAWKGSVKSSMRAMERRVFEQHGKEKGVLLLASAFRVYDYMRRVA